LYKAKRPLKRPFIFTLILISLVLSACSRANPNESWPGLSTDGETVYVAYGAGVIAYNVESNSQEWSFPAEPSSALPFYAAPSIQNERIVVGNYGASGGFLSPSPIITIYGLEENDSGSPRELWSDNQLATDRIVAPPLQVEDIVYVGTADNKLFALDATNGVEQWRFETTHSIWAQPTYADGTLFVASLDRHLYALDAEDGSLKWQTELSGALSGKPIVGAGLVYVTGFENKLQAIDMNSGDVSWVFDTSGWVWSEPALVDNVLYFADSNGVVYAIDATTANQIWQQQAPGPVQTSPVVHDGRVYVASQGDPENETEQGVLIAYSATDGTEEWQQLTVAPLNATPVIVGDDVVVTLQSETALLIGYNLETGGQSWTFLPQEPQ